MQFVKVFGRAAVLAACVTLAATVGAGFAAAQGLPGANPQGRDCQTVRTCNFSRTASVRGCLSSYTCRTCRLTNTRCSIGPNIGQRVCQEMRCGWGG